ncbi:MAG TPA: hypothetical protein VFN74_17135, partial [Chloroflexota bacterium]|nr:hypothetical protein [Chloroflexota bacterium]
MSADLTGASRVMRRHAAVLLTLVVAACVQLYQVALFGQLPDHYDYWLQEHVHLAVLRRALLGGELPLWNPYLAGGTPHLADPQSAAFYPLTALPLLAFTPEQVARVSIPLHVALAGVGAYALALSFGASRAAALVAGLGYMLAPHFAPIELPTYLQQSAAWTPWVLWALRLGMQRRSAAWLVAAGALFGLQLLRGYPQTWYFTALLAGAFGVVVLAAHPRLAARAVVAAVVALAVGAAQLLPSVDLLSVSHRSAAFTLAEAAGRGRVALHNLLGQAGPDAEVSGAYPGVALLVLAVLGTAFGARGPARFLVGAAVVGLALCVGSATPLWGLAHRVLPGFSLWHMPHRVLFIWSLSIAVLAALGVEALRTRWRRLPAVVPMALAVLVASDLLSHTLPRLVGGFYDPGAVYAQPEAARWLTEQAADNEPVRFASATYGPRVGQYGELKAPDNRRLAYLPPNVSAMYPGLDAFQGYLAIRLRRSGDVFNAINDVGEGSRLLSIRDARPALLDVYGVRYFVTDEVEAPDTRLRLSLRGTQVRIWESPTAYPYAFWVSGPLAESLTDAARSPAAPDARGGVAVERRGFNGIDLEVTAPADGHVVVNQLVAAGWRAFVDGRRAPLVIANGGQQAVPLTAGTHRVVLRYLPGSVVVGAALTGGASAALALWGLS